MVDLNVLSALYPKPPPPQEIQHPDLGKILSTLAQLQMAGAHAGLYSLEAAKIAKMLPLESEEVAARTKALNRQAQAPFQLGSIPSWLGNIPVFGLPGENGNVDVFNPSTNRRTRLGSGIPISPPSDPDFSDPNQNPNTSSGLPSWIGPGIGLPGRAAGGPLDAGQASVVGEQGPEVFVPSQPGTVIPNSALDPYADFAAGIGRPDAINAEGHPVIRITPERLAQAQMAPRPGVFGVNPLTVPSQANPAQGAPISLPGSSGGGAGGQQLSTTAISPVGGKADVNDSADAMLDTSNPEGHVRPNPMIPRKYVGTGNNRPRAIAMEQSRIDQTALQKQTQAANAVMYGVGDMSNDIKTLEGYIQDHQDSDLAKIMTTPGTAADTRLKLLNAWATTHSKDKGLQEVVAAIYSWQKNSILTGFRNITSTGLSAREALPVIQAALSAAPNFGLPLDSSKLLMHSLTEQNNRNRDMDAFFNKYKTMHGGITDGWRQAFDRDFPIEKYVARARFATIPGDTRAQLPNAVTSLREARDNYMKAEASGDKDAIKSARDVWNTRHYNFDRSFGYLADYFAFGTHGF